MTTEQRRAQIDALSPFTREPGFQRFELDGAWYTVARVEITTQRSQRSMAWTWYPDSDPNNGGPWRRTCKQAVADLKDHLLGGSDAQEDPEARTLHEALRARGYTSRKDGDVQRRTVLDGEGAVVGSFTATEAWRWLAEQERAR